MKTKIALVIIGSLGAFFLTIKSVSAQGACCSNPDPSLCPVGQVTCSLNQPGTYNPQQQECCMSGDTRPECLYGTLPTCSCCIPGSYSSPCPNPLPPSSQICPAPSYMCCDGTDAMRDKWQCKAPNARTCDYTSSSLEVQTPFGKVDPENLTRFAGQLIRLALGLSGMIALVLVIIGGYGVMTSSGQPDKLNASKETITSALLGVAFIALAVSIFVVIGKIFNLPGL